MKIYYAAIRRKADKKLIANVFARTISATETAARIWMRRLKEKGQLEASAVHLFEGELSPAEQQMLMDANLSGVVRTIPSYVKKVIHRFHKDTSYYKE